MRGAAVALAILLVLVAGVLPAGAGLVRAFSADRVTTADGRVLVGSVAAENEQGVRILTDRATLELKPAEVKSVERHVAWTSARLARVFADPLTWQALGWTTLVAVLGTLGALAIGLPFALLTARTDLPGKALFTSLYGAPLVLPPLLTAMAWDTVLPTPWQEGPEALGRFWTALQAAGLFALAYFPFVTLFARRSLAAVGASEEEAAGLAAGPWRALWRVTLPLARPGIAMGALFAFVFCLNDFSVVDFLNLFRPFNRTLAVVPYLVQVAFSRKTGSVEDLLAAGIPVAILSLVAAVLALRLAARTPTATVGSSWRAPRPLPLGPAGKALGVAFCGGVLIAGALLPAAALLFEAGPPATYQRVFGAGTASAALRLTLGLAAIATVLAVPAAFVLADAGRRLSRGSEALGGLLAVLPLALLPALVPLGSLFLWERPAFTMERDGRPWNPIYDTSILPALVVFSRVFPFALAATWASMREVDPSMQEAAEAAGVPWDLRLRHVLLPLVRPGVALGALLAFVFAVRELDSLAVLGTPTLVRSLWTSLHFARDPSVAAMAVVLLDLMALAFGIAAVTGMLRPRLAKD